MNSTGYVYASQRAVSQLFRCERDSVPNSMMLAAARESPVPSVVIERVIMCTTYGMMDPAIRRRLSVEPYISTVADAVWQGQLSLTPGY